MRLFMLICFCTLLSSCAVVEWFLIPAANDTLQVRPNTSTEQVFSCAELTLKLLRQANGQWQNNITKREVSSGIFETDNFPTSRGMGFRVRLVYEPQENILEMDLKGTGLYFSDLGVDQGIIQFKEILDDCLSK
jgi:hypothetical protein